MNYLNKKKQLSCHVKKRDEGVLLINQDIYKIFIKNEQNFFFTFFHREIYFSSGRKEKRGEDYPLSSPSEMYIAICS
jgi:hypothetical protein